ncbi:MAG: hypothetical protein ACD_58C00210G0004 [uncultured bacterium]|uniref:Uncharacterized protein n=1 Tax=Berkelbacteria bacterium GW2011_GWA2_38_9 TaxID=1618334 RepID=A0A0G0LQ04_9BACT|nr:MAG: hypothetical protein ACD_58C00210G0004 [uncultured bacterium]KKQ90065.1 MAG: hypothetical protein UT11_C0013G0009 [Berkelbacteria bacterium GW2011_GWA2_38_9]
MEPELLARKITDLISKEAFKLFRNKKFRRLTNFRNIKQIEQDRIFNELAVTGICLAMLMFETASEVKRDSQQNEEAQFLQLLSGELKFCYGSILKEIRVEEEFVVDWRTLTEMRLKEYQENFEESKTMFDFKKQNPWISICSIGGFLHITRSKGQPNDLLFKIILNWVGNLSLKMLKLTLNYS